MLRSATSRRCVLCSLTDGSLLLFDVQGFTLCELEVEWDLRQLKQTLWLVPRQIIRRQGRHGRRAMATLVIWEHEMLTIHLALQPMACMLEIITMCSVLLHGHGGGPRRSWQSGRRSSRRNGAGGGSSSRPRRRARR